MKNNNDIPEPDVFTNKIEETIDDLFKPVKQIEIDPLTQEIKEIDSEEKTPETPPEKEPEIELELAIEETEEEKKTPVEAAEDDEKTQCDVSEDSEPEIELELIDEDDGEKLELDMEEVEKQKDEKDETVSRLQKLREEIYTIEWEVSGQELSEILSELTDILELPGIKQRAVIFEILSLSAKVVEEVARAPEQMAARTPHVLKKSIETVIDIYSSNNADKTEIEKIGKELNGLLSQKTVPETETAPSAPPEKPKESVKAEVNASEAVKTDKAERTAAPRTIDKEAQEVLISHIQELQKEVNRILPLERLLSNTSGMEKLYNFHKGVRSNLERQISILSRYFFADVDIELPKPDLSEHRREDFASEIEPHGCPWKELLTFSIEGREIGIPADEVAYISQPPWLSKSFIKKAATIPLSKLKPWPWSKLASLFSNTLAGLDEKEILKLEFPVVSDIGGIKLTTGSDYYVVVLFNGKKGAILRTDETPISINVPAEAKYKLDSQGSFAGVVEVNGNTILVLTADSINRQG